MSFLGTTQPQSAIADIIVNDVTGLQTALDSKVTTNSAQALHSTDALRISGNTISLYKGNGGSESVTVPQTTVDTASVLAATAGASSQVVGGYALCRIATINTETNPIASNSNYPASSLDGVGVGTWKAMGVGVMVNTFVSGTDEQIAEWVQVFLRIS